jgi:predicted enzyme related to lactoylglutathione lyase
MSVESIEDAAAKIEAEGGKVLQGEMPIPGMGYFAICEDTQGNQIGTFSTDPTATM